MARTKSLRREVKRVQVDMAPKSLERMKRLVDITEAASYAEVVKNSLRLYEAIILEVESGSEIYIKRGDQIVPYPIFST